VRGKDFGEAIFADVLSLLLGGEAATSRIRRSIMLEKELRKPEKGKMSRKFLREQPYEHPTSGRSKKKGRKKALKKPDSKGENLQEGFEAGKAQQFDCSAKRRGPRGEVKEKTEKKKEKSC